MCQRSISSQHPNCCRFVAAAILLALGLVLCGCARAEKAAGYQTDDDYRVTFATEPSPPVVGKGKVTVTVLDKAGEPVEDARVSLEANMSHAGMVPVYAESAAGAGGIYDTALEWTMGGAWYVDAKITLPNGEEIRRRFPVDVN